MLNEALSRGIKRAVVAGRGHTPLSWLRRRNVIILMYHGFFTRGQPGGIEEYGNRWCAIEDFDKQLLYLKKHYNVISLDRLIECYTTKENLPNNAVIITMDDGYQSNYTLAYPLLKQYQIPATISVAVQYVNDRNWLWADRIDYSIWKAKVKKIDITVNGHSHIHFIGSETEKQGVATKIRAIFWGLPYKEMITAIDTLEKSTKASLFEITDVPKLMLPLKWEQMQEMIKSGLISIGSHSVSHPNLTTCSDDELLFEVIESRRTVERELERDCTFFCYPGGRYSRRVKQYVKRAGYSCGLAIGGRFVRKMEADTFEVPRIGVGRSMTYADFIFTICDPRRK